jgi:predicted transcriptional regulator
LSDALDLFFELSNEDRLQILTTLKGNPSKLTQISNALKLPNQEVSRQLARLTILELCYRDGEGAYRLTPYAEHALMLTSGYEFLSRNRAYFRTHTAMGLPGEFQLRIGELSECKPISEVLTNMYDVQKMIEGAKEHIWYIVEQGNLSIALSLESAVKRGVDYRVLMPDNIKPSEPYEQYIKSWPPNHPLRSANVQRRYLDRLPIGLAVSENGVSQILFPTLEGKLDYAGFKGDDQDATRWCMDLFLYYWERGSTALPGSFKKLLS